MKGGDSFERKSIFGIAPQPINLDCIPDHRFCHHIIQAKRGKHESTRCCSEPQALWRPNRRAWLATHALHIISTKTIKNRSDTNIRRVG
jgi:hypothetical protein